MRILFIEDEGDIAEAAQLGLEDAHYQVDLAADGQTGLQMAADQKYDLILLDVMLPGIT